MEWEIFLVGFNHAGVTVLYTLVAPDENRAIDFVVDDVFKAREMYGLRPATHADIALYVFPYYRKIEQRVQVGPTSKHVREVGRIVLCSGK